MLRPVLILSLVLVALAAPTSASAKHGGGDEARIEATCGSGVSAELRAKAKDGAIAVELRIDSRRSGERWRVVLVHERRVAWRGTVRTRGGGDLRVRRTLPDFGGADEITTLASGPRGVRCQATAVLSGS
ncbi:hypothetical protein [Conexibacter sp. CPCC 206217]|uniref:hypothetical protein n=1 Tax=Conexibacter sp. CPCC 206217 TaxID=3064574 RepID=UPI0027225C52|nr:hypothetical protein [Conexibacter sp. CPCC 206217]MDO8212394.1 hypothetical protein [Conexibacter sp. CPCC 206217]